MKLNLEILSLTEGTYGSTANVPVNLTKVNDTTYAANLVFQYTGTTSAGATVTYKIPSTLKIEKSVAGTSSGIVRTLVRATVNVPVISGTDPVTGQLTVRSTRPVSLHTVVSVPKELVDQRSTQANVFVDLALGLCGRIVRACGLQVATTQLRSNSSNEAELVPLVPDDMSSDQGTLVLNVGSAVTGQATLYRVLQGIAESYDTDKQIPVDPLEVGRLGSTIPWSADADSVRVPDYPATV